MKMAPSGHMSAPVYNVRGETKENAETVLKAFGCVKVSSHVVLCVWVWWILHSYVLSNAL